MNGGSTAQKVDFAYNLLEKAVSVNTVFSQNEVSGLPTCRGAPEPGLEPRLLHPDGWRTDLEH